MYRFPSHIHVYYLYQYKHVHTCREVNVQSSVSMRPWHISRTPWQMSTRYLIPDVQSSKWLCQKLLDVSMAWYTSSNRLSIDLPSL